MLFIIKLYVKYFYILNSNTVSINNYIYVITYKGKSLRTIDLESSTILDWFYVSQEVLHCF